MTSADKNLNQKEKWKVWLQKFESHKKFEFFQNCKDVFLLVVLQVINFVLNPPSPLLAISYKTSNAKCYFILLWWPLPLLHPLPTNVKRCWWTISGSTQTVKQNLTTSFKFELESVI